MNHKTTSNQPEMSRRKSTVLIQLYIIYYILIHGVYSIILESFLDQFTLIHLLILFYLFVPVSQKSDAKAASQSTTTDDIWDDRLLIKAYEQAILLTGSDIAKGIASDTNKTPFLSQPFDASVNDDASEETTNQFKVGDTVRATYDVDNIDYEARIISIDEESGDCIIRFIGYENEQTVRLVDLVDSWGEQEQQKQEFEAAAADAETDSSNVDSENAYPRELYRNNDFQGSLPIPPIPPLPPTLKASLADESEHFSAMLMSWYMSGYYTGLYQGHKLAKEQQKKKSSKRK